jgi:O-antigen/teichoic acid export membrane protein
VSDDHPELPTAESRSIDRPYRRVWISTSSVFGATFVVALLGTVSLRAMTVHLGPASYGLFATATTYVGIATLLTDLGVNSVSGRAIARTPGDVSVILGCNMGLRLMLSLVFVPLIWVVGNLAYRGHAHGGTLVLGIAIVSCAIPFDAVRAVSLSYFVSRIENHRTAMINVIQQSIFVALVVVAVASEHSVVGCYLAYLGSMIVASVLAYLSVRSRVHFRPQWSILRWREIIKESLTIGVIQVANTMYLMADRIMLSLLLGVTASTSVGYYQVAYAIVSFFLVIPSMYMTSMMPLMTTASGSTLPGLVTRSIRHLSIISALVAAGCLVTAPGVIQFLAGAKFAPAVMPLSILSISVLLSSLTQVFGFANFSKDRHHNMLLVSLVGLAVNVGLNFWAIPRYGVNGAAVVTTISECVMAFGTFKVFHSKVGHTISVLPLLARPIFAAAGSVGVVHLLCGPESVALMPTIVRGVVVVVAFAGLLAVLGGWPREVSEMLRQQLRRAGAS